MATGISLRVSDECSDVRRLFFCSRQPAESLDK